jgi:uncharacterized protein CbrC (UPF0167 family)
MRFEYFQGPISDMAMLCKEEKKCSICNSTGNCFELGTAIIQSEEASEAGYGCMECLSNGKFEFWHDTDIGVLDEKGLSKAYKHNQPPPSNFPEAALVALRRTPQIATWQQELWLSHCNDFMAYQGTWQPEDFFKQSANGDGHALFIKMTDKEYTHLWESSLPNGETVLKAWHATYYTFKCRHCGKLRGNWDCD